MKTANLYENMARTYWAALGDIENGYICFEKSVDLWERYYQLPFETETEYKTDIFSRLTWKKKARLTLADGLIDFDYPERYLDFLTNSSAYDSVRNDERFIKCMKRIEKYCEK